MIKTKAPLSISVRTATVVTVVTTVLSVLMIQACSGNRFHLRKEQDLPKTYQRIQIQNLSYTHDLLKAFEVALEESGGELIDANSKSPVSQIAINNLREGKRVVAYTKQRKAREFLLYLKFNYTITPQGKRPEKLKPEKLKKERINLDRIFIYDADFALGKAEEEKQIRQSLYKEAARLMILKLQYKQ